MLKKYKKPIILTIVTLFIFFTLYGLVQYLNQPPISILKDSVSLFWYICLLLIEFGTLFFISRKTKL